MSLLSFISPESVAGSVLVLSLVIALGLLIGEVQVAGIKLGIAGVLFSGILFAHMGYHVSEHIMEFAREFGLILFVYTIGMQVGPGIISSLRRDGLPLNLMAAGIVFLGVGMTLIAHFVGRIDVPAVVGVYAGAVTNTPGLGAAQQALKELPTVAAEAAKLPGLGYAVAYPFGIMGIILTMIVVRKLFRIDSAKEAEAFAALQTRNAEPLATMNIEVKNPNLDGLPIRKLPSLPNIKVTISRVKQGERIVVADGDLALHVGDILLAVGTKDHLNQFRMVVGAESPVDLRKVASQLTTRRVVVTRRAVIGETIQELDFLDRFGVVVTRVSRSGVEFAARSGIRVQFGDTLLIVGESDDLLAVEKEVGNSARRLNQPQIASIFIGIALGVIIGSWPIHVPGLPGPVKLGLAGGPLLVAILMSRMGAVGPFVSYMPLSANMILREVGIVLFLACVGLKAGDKFVEVLLQGQGVVWMAWGVGITLVPLLTVALVGRLVYKLNYVSLCGLLAGGMTDPPALAFASSAFHSDAPSVAYATVYPLTMILRIITAQVLVLTLLR